ncbi:MAG: divergent polysaccharide deacetylase family protein [Treponema sp.]|jgi:polysaccharide deacetylase 2 family uncharacterized protein YibQ|nr:divergent polysaccharide deacetylase family protein [Treponema sp.]
MKRAVIMPKKSVSRKKTTKKVSKIGTKTVRTTGKLSKTGSDAIRAFQLVTILVIFSVCISFAVIMVYSSYIKTHVTVDIESIDIESELPPVVSLEIEPEENNVSSALHTTVPAKPANTQSQVTASGNSSVSVKPQSGNNQTVTPSGNAGASSSQRPSERPQANSVVNSGTLVFVIDDAGNNLRELEPFLNISAPLTIAVLPGLPNSAEAARRIRAAGKEVILHQPMEAVGGQAPGPGAIYSQMSAGEIRTVLSRNIAEVGPVAGINNHQGSKVTMDREMMETILAFCAEHNLFFLDSRTTAETAAPAAARRLGIKIAERDVFIDNEQNKDAMLLYITSGLTRAQRNGSAIMIGHTWSPDLAPLLAEQFPLLVKQGYTIKTASDIIK